MSEEEKKMIKFLKGAYKLVDKGKVELQKEDIANILHLIDKQQKEIEEKTTIIMAGGEKVKQLDKQIHNFNIEKIEQQKEIEELKENSISKDKIKEKIKEVSNGTFDARIVLEKLLEE